MFGGRPSRKGMHGFAFAAMAAALVPAMSLTGVSPVAVVVLAVLSLAALVVYERGTVLRLAEENSALAQSVSLLELAESLAGVGRWRFDARTGSHQWSPELCTLVDTRAVDAVCSAFCLSIVAFCTHGDTVAAIWQRFPRSPRSQAPSPRRLTRRTHCAADSTLCAR